MYTNTEAREAKMLLKRLLRRINFFLPLRIHKILQILVFEFTYNFTIYLRLHKETATIVIRETRAHNGIAILPLQPNL